MPDQVVVYKTKSFSIVLLLIIGVLGVLLWWKSCGNQPTIDPRVAQLQKEAQERTDHEAEQKKIYEDSLKDNRGAMMLKDSLLLEKEKNVRVLSKKIDQLLADHKNESEPIPFDSNSVIISNTQFKNCTTCYSLLEAGRDSIVSLLKVRDEKDELFKKDTALRKRRTDSLEQSVKNWQAANKSLLEQYSKALVPHARFSGGLEYGTSPKVSNIGLYLMLITKKGKDISINGGLNTLGTWYAGGRLGFKIF